MNTCKTWMVLILSVFILSNRSIGQNFGASKLQIEDIVFRPASWEEEQLSEARNERPNKGGLVFVYYKNVTEEPIKIARFRINNKDQGYYVQSGEVAWTRSYGDKIQPGETMVYEINAVSEQFSEGKEFSFSVIDRKRWSSAGRTKVSLQEKKLHITSIIWEDNLKKFTLHFQNTGNKKWEIGDVTFSGKNILNYKATADSIEPNGHIILSGELEETFEPGSLCVVAISLKNKDENRTVYAHRTAYDSYFAIGTWGVDKHRYAEAKNKLHLNTFIRGGKSTDEFYTSINKRHKFKILTHAGMYPDVDKIDDLKKLDDIAFWYLQDEPDFNRTAEAVLFSNEMTKRRNITKPTITTLCRNVKFFEFAFIPDVACMDHYSVGAPTSSVWPNRYGTKLEETGYYTRDLRLAAFPKPIWVWSQGLFNWNERPKQQVPTAKELTYQLLSNIGNGAKGILWFTIKESKAKKYPETYLAMQQCGRILEMMKEDLLESEPLQTKIESNEILLIHPIISKDKLILIILNSDYVIDPVAYQWKSKQDVDIKLKIPAWFKAESAYELIPEEGVESTKFQQENNNLSLNIKNIEAYKIFVFDTNKTDLKELKAKYTKLKLKEE